MSAARSRRSVAFALVLAALAMPLASAAPWLQYGHDAARTSATPDPGPETDDVAFRVAATRRMGPYWLPTVVVADGSVFVASGDFGRPTSDILRVSLADASVVPFVSEPIRIQRVPGPGEDIEVHDAPTWLASDGVRLFSGGWGPIRAYDLATGEKAWEVPVPRLTNAPIVQTICLEPVVADRLYVMCAQTGDGIFDIRDIGLAIDIDSGDVAWTWMYDASAWSADLPASAPSPCTPPLGGTCIAPTGLPQPAGLGLAGRNLVVTMSAVGARGVYEFSAIAIDAESGRTVNRFQAIDPNDLPVVLRPNSCRLSSGASSCANSAYPLVGPASTPTGVYLQFGNILRFVDHDLLDEQRPPVPLERDGRAGYGSFPESFALSEERVFAAGARTIHSVADATETAGWPIQPLPQTEYWASPLVLAAGRTLFAASVSDENTDVLYAFDARDGQTLWKRSFPKPMWRGGGFAGTSTFISDGIRFAVGEGVVAVYASDGNLTVIGRTPASIAVSAEPETSYPDLNEPVEVDLSSTRPGVFGPATSFAADWGDGSPVEWQSSPILSHAYNSTGDKTARFFARNDANQTASTVQVFHVGGTKPTFLEDAFSAENQNATFFILGLAGTGIGGVIGLLRLQRRRGTLERELAFLESEYARTKARPLECERMLAERKAHARSLLLDRKLEESQVSVIERRVEELTRTVRMHEIEELLDLIPRGLARALEEVLADGRITTWERRSFLHVLEDDRFLSPDAKARVRAIIDDWYARDTGRAAAGPGQGQAQGEGRG